MCANHFDKQFVVVKLRNIRRCPKCRFEYESKYGIGHAHVKSIRPFLLQCGHDMCENCIYQNQQNLSCVKCSHPVEIKKLPFQQNFFVRDQFDINYFLFGEIYNSTFVTKSCKSNNSYKNNAQSKIQNALCHECETASSDGNCQQCSSDFCKNCFTAVHSNSKVLLQHALMPLRKNQNNDGLVKIPNPKICRKHKKVCGRYCPLCKFICCVECARIHHTGHGCKSLIDANIDLNDEMMATFENLRTTRENLQRAYKDIKAIDMQLEDYASQTVENISDYFLMLHSFLQNEERRILEHFEAVCLEPQNKIRKSYNHMKEAQTALTSMRTHLENYQQKPPSNVYLGSVFNAYNTRLEQLQCQVVVSKITENPFYFEPLIKDFRSQFSKYIRYSYNDPEISINIGSLYADNITVSSKSGSIPLLLPQQIPSDDKIMQLGTVNNTVDTFLTPVRIVVSPDISLKKRSQRYTDGLAHVSCVKTPEHFFIQMMNLLPKIQELSNAYACMRRTEMVPKQIKEGFHYMVHQDNDNLWYRGVVKTILSQNRYKVFLIDIGISVEAPTEKFYKIKEEHMKMPCAAILCALNNLIPADTQWTKEANNLIFEITRNQPVRCVTIEQVKDDILKVDLYTTGAEPISLRDSFLYTGLARERSGVFNLNLQSKKLSPIAQRLPKRKLKSQEILFVKVIHIEDPQDFYVIRVEDIDAKSNMVKELNDFYNDKTASHDNIYLALLQMACVVYVDKSWHRCCVLAIEEKGNIRVRLVDEGSETLVNWRNIYAMAPKFRERKEFAIKCSLADIEPLQCNNYAWTEMAINEFKYMTSNPKLRISVRDARPDAFIVSMHIVKKNMEYNIGGVLAKNGFGVSTGEASQFSPTLLNQFERKIVVPPSLSKKSIEHALFEIQKDRTVDPVISMVNENFAVKAPNRTELKVLHIINPSEFYAQITKLSPGILKFREKMQEYALDLTAELEKSWTISDHCWVHTHRKLSVFQSSTSQQFEWQRGIIIAISINETNDEKLFTVFLRDTGSTIKSVEISQLCSITHEWDRITNAVQRCHLANIKPPAELPTWPETATEYLMHSVSNFETLSATLRGVCEKISLPIVLWGTNIETDDPLAPCRPRHTNINLLMVTAGLATVNKLPGAKDEDKLLEIKTPEGEISFSEWFRDLDSAPFMQAIERCSKTTIDKRESATASTFDDEFSLDLIDLNANIDITVQVPIKAPEAWVRFHKISKSIFTAYPTYVDFECIIYMHWAENHNFLKNMSSKIMEIYGKAEYSPDVVYNPGDACIAKYHLDKRFYRGIVQQYTTKDGYSVQFVDYGNVETMMPEDMRPFAPFPTLPALACKYRLDGIGPRHNAKAYSISVLDTIHSLIVDKMVSVRVPTCELTKKIKFCSIRIGGADLANMLIQGHHVDGHVQRPYGGRVYQQKSTYKKPLIVNAEERENGAAVKEFSNMHDITEFEAVLNNFDDNDEPDEHLDNLVRGKNITENKYNSDNSVLDNKSQVPSPPKRPMFDAGEYQNFIWNGDIYNMQEDSGAVISMECDDDALQLANGVGEEEEVSRLERSFAMNYWHADMNFDENNAENNLAKDHAIPDLKADQIQEEEYEPEVLVYEKYEENQKMLQLIEDSKFSEFETFEPKDTSSVFSHFSGIDRFKRARLPEGLRSFKCSVVKILSPTVLHIFPHLAEFEFQAIELSRKIKQIAQIAEPLTKFERSTICLSRYSVDKQWYRAIILSHNKIGEQVDVVYVDYLNTETVPIRYIRQCPMELVKWPLRTFQVRLYGIKANASLRESNVCSELKGLISQRILLARVKKVVTSKNRTEQVALYENEISSTTIYENLVTQNIYQPL